MIILNDIHLYRGRAQLTEIKLSEYYKMFKL